jgi:hypothetical protein
MKKIILFIFIFFPFVQLASQELERQTDTSSVFLDSLLKSSEVENFFQMITRESDSSKMYTNRSDNSHLMENFLQRLFDPINGESFFMSFYQINNGREFSIWQNDGKKYGTSFLLLRGYNEENVRDSIIFYYRENLVLVDYDTVIIETDIIKPWIWIVDEEISTVLVKRYNFYKNGDLVKCLVVSWNDGRSFNGWDDWDVN